MPNETDESDPARPGDKRGPNGEKPLSVTEQPKLELRNETSARRNLWAKGNARDAKTQTTTANPSRKARVGALATKIYYDEAYRSSRSGDETSFWDLLHAKVQLDLWDTSGDLEKGEVKLTLAKVHVKGTLVHAQVDLVEVLGGMLFPSPPQPVPPPFTPPPPCAARVGDPTCHGSPLGPGSGSPDVLIGGLPAWRASIDVHVCGMPGHGSGSVAPGALSVLINGSPPARAGDCVLEPGGGANVILRGASTVLIGPRAAPPRPAEAAPRTDDLPWVKLEAILQQDLLTGSADAAAAVEVDVDEARMTAQLQGGLALGLGEAELPMRLRIRIPGTARYLGLGVTPQLAALGIGAEAGARAKLDPERRDFQLTAGAKVSLGVGAGMKFSVDVSE